MSTNFCPDCGTAITPGAGFCAHCGHLVDEAGPLTEGAPGPGRADPAPPTGPPAPPTGTGWQIPPPGSAANGKPKKLIGLIVGLVVLALILLTGGVVATLLLVRGGDEQPVALEAVGEPVASPFTSSVTRTEMPLASADRNELLGASPRVTGSTPGLYGGTQDQQTCDQQQMIDYLTAPEAEAKAVAWAEAQEIDTDEIRTFVAELTPVQLRVDTAVTNHGFEDERANAYPAILQAGTAVMVDEYGVPRAKCSCGNPLDEPGDLPDDPTYAGKAWDGFDADSVAVVEAEDVVSTFVLIDPLGKEIRRQVGDDGSTSGGADGPVAPSETPDVPDTGGPSGTDAPVLAEIQSILATSNGPTAPSVVELPAARITAIQTYHWNDANGAAPGTVGLRGSDGTVYGPFRATGSEGQGGVPNAYWTAVTSFEVPAGGYTVIDSNPATWSSASDIGGRGMVRIWGVTRSGGTVSAPEAETPDRSSEAIAAVRARFCQGIEEYVAGVKARSTGPDAYLVDVRIELDSGAWTARFDVDLSGSPRVVARDPDSGALLC